MKNEKPIVGVYKIFPDAKMPLLADSGSACYDLYAHLKKGDRVVYYDSFNHKNEVELREDFLVIHNHHRFLIPTGIKFDIPEGYSLRIHPKSGQSLKKGIGLANDEGVIDWSYIEQTYILIINQSLNIITIEDGERIAQVELVPVLSFEFKEIDHDLEKKTTRFGGLGSTGIKELITA